MLFDVVLCRLTNENTGYRVFWTNQNRGIVEAVQSVSIVKNLKTRKSLSTKERQRVGVHLSFERSETDKSTA